MMKIHKIPPLVVIIALLMTISVNAKDIEYEEDGDIADISSNYDGDLEYFGGYIPSFDNALIEPTYEGYEDFSYDYNSQNEDEIVITRYNGHSKDVIIPEKIEGKPVVKLAANTFLNLDFVESIDIPESVRECSGAIKGCVSIKEIKTPLKNYGLSFLFDHGKVPSLKKVVIKGNEIKDYALNYATDGESCVPNLSEVVLSSYLTKIGDGAFSHSQITEIIIPDSVTQIGRNAFSDCDKLEMVYLSSELKSVQPYLFSGCTNLKKVVLPTELEEIGEYAFSGCKNLIGLSHEMTLDDEYDGLFLPSTIITIGNYAFNDCVSISRVTLPNKIETIGKGIFQGCMGIKVMNIPMYNDEKLSRLSSYFLGNWNDLEQLYIHKIEIRKGTSDTIPERFFIGIPIKEVIINNGITTVGERAFLSSAHLESVNIADSVENIGKSAFYGCRNLKTVELPKMITEIPENAFNTCENLNQVYYDENNEYKREGSIVLPNMIESIGEGAFRGCEKITTLYMPDSLSLIEKDAFGMCKTLKYLHGGKNVKEIKERAFYQYSDGSLLETKLDSQASFSLLTYDWKSDYRAIGQNNRFNWGKDNFKFTNYSDYDVYELVGKNKHKINLSNKLKDAQPTLSESVINSAVESTWNQIHDEENLYGGGHCYGMAHLVDEVRLGKSIKDYNIDTSSIHKLEKKQIDELLDWFMLKQLLDINLENVTLSNHVDEFEQTIMNKQGAVVNIRFIDNINTKHGHSIYVYGIEEKNNANEAIWEYENCDKRYLVYDVNSEEQSSYDDIDDYNLSESDKYNLYCNSNTKEFFIPFYEDRGWEIECLWYEDYEDFQSHDRLLKLSERSITTSNPNTLTVYGGKDKSSLIDLEWETLYGYTNENSFYRSVLPENRDTLYVENIGKNPLDVGVLIKDLYIGIDSQSVDAIDISSNCIKLNGNIKKTKIELVSDKKPLHGYEVINVSADSISEAKIEVNDNGIIASSKDGVNGIDIQLESIYEEDKKCDFNIASEKESILIREDDEKIEVLEDSDGDGEYDTVVESYSNEYHDGLWLKGLDEKGYKYNGKSITPNIDVYSGDSKLVLGKDYSISYKNNKNVYTISESEQGFDPKKAPSITVTGKGNYDSKDVVYFKILPQNIGSEDFNADDITLPISTKPQKIKPVLYWNGKALKQKTDYTCAVYKMSDTEFKNPLGLSVTSDEPCIVRFTGTGNFTDTRDINLTFAKDQKIVSSLKIDKVPAAIYTGFPITPEPAVRDGSTVLVRGVHYSVTYASNVNPGTGYVIITGAPENGYSGTKRVPFKINDQKGSKAGAYDISPDKDTANRIQVECASTVDYVKGGAKPAITVKFTDDNNNIRTLTEGIDYKLSYKNNTSVTTNANVVITGKGSFKGSRSQGFAIKAKNISTVSAYAEDKVYQNKANIYATKITLTDSDGKKLSVKKDYQVDKYTYLNDTEVTVGGNKEIRKAGAEIGKQDILSVGTVIEVTLSAVNGSGYTGTAKPTYRISNASISSAKVTIPTQTYTGKPIELDPTALTVTVKGQRLTTSDFEIVGYENNTNKGAAKVTIRGKGNYGGYKMQSFKIKAKAFRWWWHNNN